MMVFLKPQPAVFHNTPKVGAFFIEVIMRIITGLLLYSIVGWTALAEVRDSLSTAQTDSALYRLDEVIVSASRTEILLIESPVAAEVFSMNRLRERNADVLSDALSGSTALFIKDYGGSNIKTIALRGMNAENTVFMVNGVRLSNMQNGVVDCGDIPIEMIDRIEVIRSGNSAIVGADAVAGSVNIVFSQDDERPSLTLNSTVGSFGSQKAGVSIRQRIGPVSIAGGGFVEHSNGNFPFILSGPSELVSHTRDNNDYNRKNFLLSLSTMSGASFFIRTLLWYGVSERGIPGQILSQPTPHDSARQRDRTLRFLLSSGFPITGAIRCRLTADMQKLYQRYQDPFYPYGDGPLDTYSSNTMGGVAAEIDFSIVKGSMLVFGTEIRQYVLEGNELTTKPRRDQQSVFSTCDLRWQGLGNVIESVSVLPALRYDRFSDIGSKVSPKLAAALRSVPVTGWWMSDATITVRGSIGKNYRVPTFNDLYWPWSGNPNLRPENSTSGEAGVILKNEFLLPHMIEITWFNIHTIDRIMWAPVEGGLWVPQNIGKSLSTGFEFSLTIGTTDERISLNGNYSILKTTKENSEGENDLAYKKQFPFIPCELGSVTLRLNQNTVLSWLPRMWMSTELHYTGLRYTSAENDPVGVLPSFAVAGLSYGADLLIGSFRSRCVVSVKNLFNCDYEVMSGYPMPRSSFTLSLMIQF
jgi:vitamin B12 transporter